jgi:hypothetical protein
VHEPDRLLLAWQAPDVVGDRQRWAVGELTRVGMDARLRYFADEEFQSLNFNQPFGKILGYGYRGYPAFPRDQLVHEDNVLEALMRRLPPRNRSDFGRYREHLSLRPKTEISDFALLGLSEAQLPSDGFSVVDPLSPDVKHCELISEVASYRYYAKNHPQPNLGQVVDLVPEPGNTFDPNAIMVMIGDGKLGYINRIQAPAILEWIRQCRASAAIERLNGRPDRPRAFIYLAAGPL